MTRHSPDFHLRIKKFSSATRKIFVFSYVAFLAWHPSVSSLLSVSRFFFAATNSRSWFPIVKHDWTYFKRECVPRLQDITRRFRSASEQLYSAPIGMMYPPATWIFNHQRPRLTWYVISWERRRLHLRLVILTLSVKVKHRSRLLNELRLDDAEKW